MRTAGHEPHTGTRSADDAEKRVACGCSAAARQHCVQDQRSIPERRLCHAPHSGTGAAARAGRKADKGTAERISGTAEPAERRPLSGSGCSR